MNGLPPVGTVCEAMLPSMKFQWAEAVVVWHHPDHEGSAVVVHGGGRLTGWSSTFRPIRTPEQIAAEEREKIAQNLFKVLNPGSKWHKCDDEVKDRYRHAIVDFGYRKQVEP
ncbi:hypothetical protein [Pseudomonas trivialis]|uniref:Uncharacterized protein n=1 Tax=Pseudomonas trivialis TaxID=200450 RepID=A0ABY0UHH5_9PSED|nr:hypothetical protein [Pseudomonas trivialis]SDS69053.1 hypothetical protein SAMN04490205_3306 [Pseudomonas trivialis]